MWKFLCFSPSLPTIATILTITLVIWQIICKMTSKEAENETAAIVRALITARGMNGATLDDIKGSFTFDWCASEADLNDFSADYEQQIGQSLSQGHDDVDLAQWLRNLKDVKMQWKHGKIVYFSSSSAHQHLACMVGPRKSARGKRKPKIQASWLNNSQRFDNATQTTPKTWTNSLVFRRSRRSHVPSFQPAEFIGNEISTHTPDQPIINEAPPEAPKLPSLQNVSQEHIDEYNMTGFQDHSCETEADSGHHSNASSLSNPLDHTSNFFASYFGDIDEEVRFFKQFLTYYLLQM